MALGDRLRALPTLNGALPGFDADLAAATPQLQFAHWLQVAIAAGVAEPHAMTLSTLAPDGSPDARVLILKDVDARGWHFATSMLSQKGRQLADDARAALTFYWPLLGQQIRLRGHAVYLGAAISAADFRARGSGARAIAMLDRQSSVMADPAALEAAIADGRQRLEADPEAVTPAWAVFALVPDVVEFWQGDSERRHTRLQYIATADGWIRRRLWP